MAWQCDSNTSFTLEQAPCAFRRRLWNSTAVIPSASSSPCHGTAANTHHSLHPHLQPPSLPRWVLPPLLRVGCCSTLDTTPPQHHQTAQLILGWNLHDTVQSLMSRECQTDTLDLTPHGASGVCSRGTALHLLWIYLYQ